MAKKVSISFKDTEIEQEIFEWLETKSEIVGYSSAIKQMLYELMLKEKGKK